MQNKDVFQVFKNQ